MRQRFDEFRRMGIKTIMITGDNPLTAATIAREAGVDDFVPQAKPEDKIRIIRDQQAEGHLVAMTGDGTNDAPALAQADVGLAIIALVPLALRGVGYRPAPASELLGRNLLIYGIGGIIVPFLGIKIIDVIVSALRLA